MSRHPIQFILNGREIQREVPANQMLATLLREDLQTTGVKRGCETGACGACSVLLNGELVKSCLMLAVHADGAELTSVEGLGSPEQLHPLQQAFMQCGGLQCGYCTPGMLLAACALLNNQPRPSRQEIQQGISGNICRCTGYTQIIESIEQAAEQLHGNC